MQILFPDLNKHINLERHFPFMLPHPCGCADLEFLRLRREFLGEIKHSYITLPLLTKG
jgi:hypothetical protein